MSSQAGGDTVEIVTPDDTPDRPEDFLGMPIHYVNGFRLIFYKQVTSFFSSCLEDSPQRRLWSPPQVQLTLDIGSKALNALKKLQPTIIHSVGPGACWRLLAPCLSTVY